ncbi:exosortase A [Aromatoleum sp.]|uniref:exosortase A n=1 Tax=Aromatoleum sp. TaxID=2307007 RepID=UPI002FC59165
MKRDADYENLAVDGGRAERDGVRGGFRIVSVTLAVSFVWLVAWYWETASEIGRIWWRSETYAHGLTVLPLFAWLIWRARNRVALLRPQPVPWMVVPIVGAGLLWLVGRLVGVAGASHFALVAMLVAGLAGVLGWRLARALLFPLAFLAFAVPVGDFLLPTLMKFTAAFTVGALRASGVPVYQEGLYFVVPNGRWSVVEACSGIRYLVASTMIGALYAYLNYTALRKRALFMGVAVVVPIVANWLRAYLIVMLGYLSNNRLAAGVDHLIYGWIFFGVVIMLMFWIGGRWRDSASPVAATATRAVPSSTDWRGALPIALAVAAFPVAQSVIDRPVDDYAVRLQLPPPAAGWSEEPPDRLDYRPSYAQARGDAFAIYRAPDGNPVGAYAAWYAHQRDGSEMVAWGNGLVTVGSRNRVISRFPVDAPNGQIQGADLVAPDGRLRVWHWYRVNGRFVTGDVEVKLRLAVDRVLGRADESSVVVLVTPELDAPLLADERLRAFVDAHGEAIEAALDAASPERDR